MRSLFLHPFFLCCAALFVLHQIGQKALGWSVPLADNYLDTLLCMPLLLTGFRAEQRWLWGRGDLSLWETLGITALLSFVFEWVFPRISAGFTADWIDVAAYFAGALLQYVASAAPGRDLQHA